MSARRFGRYTVELTREDKVLFPDAGLTKGDLADYYEKVAPTILPHLAERALTLQRFPDGIASEGFYQKEAGDLPDWVRTERLAKKGGHVNHVVCDNAATLVQLAQLACITPHVWLSRVDRPRHPDRLVFDLDPSGDDFSAVRAAAREVRELLEELGLATFVQTTGSRGMHVVAPIAPEGDFDAVRAFASAAAKVLSERYPDELTVEQHIAKRGARVYLDVARNAYAQTMVAPYAVRARPGAPVATPLDWGEVGSASLRPDQYTIRNVLRRLGAKEDPWKGMDRRARSLAGPRRRLEA